MDIQQFKDKTKKLLSQYPAYEEEIISLHQQALDAIEDGAEEEFTIVMHYADMLTIIKGSAYYDA